MGQSVRRWVEATVHIPGFHHWPAAPERRGYLRHRHRHLFHVTVGVRVTGDEREIEFHDLQDAIRDSFGWVQRQPVDFGARSCETIAREVLAHIDEVQPRRDRWCRVSEDGESGALVEICEEVRDV